MWIEADPIGLRAYAAAATGGVWYTDDGVATWKALGGWRSADPAARALRSPCQRLHAGAVHDDPGDDAVWVGTAKDP